MAQEDKTLEVLRPNWACSDANGDGVPSTTGRVAIRAGISISLAFGSQPTNCGSELTMEETKTAPVVRLEGADRDAFYTVVLVDVDAPGGPFLHAVWSDVPGDMHDFFHRPVEYVPPQPPAGTGPHRYVALAAKQHTAPLPGNGLRGLRRGDFALHRFFTENGVDTASQGYQYFVVDAPAIN